MHSDEAGAVHDARRRGGGATLTVDSTPRWSALKLHRTPYLPLFSSLSIVNNAVN
jgi:hypothetical protein